jgi:CheY-like chemotaxis protein
MPHKLLLADDSVTIQRVIELTFADEDVHVVAVGNGQEAIDRVQRDPPDIVLADVGMPERTGYEVAAFVKGNPDTAHIPVVLLTGAFEPVDEGRARAVGCDGILVKPFEPQLVISRVKELLAGRQPAGMWSSAPPAQGPVRQAPQDLASRAPAAGSSATDPLEAYFDQLDAAFSSAGASTAVDSFGGPPAQPVASAAARPDTGAIPLSRRPAPSPAVTSGGDPLAGWDPDLVGDPTRPAPSEAPQQSPRPAAQAAIPVAPAAPPSLPAPALPTSLVDAFTALLSAEQKLGLSPSVATAQSARAGSAPAGITDDVIDAVAERVLARLSAQSRPTILDVAERLVREEIERLKQ